MGRLGRLGVPLPPVGSDGRPLVVGSDGRLGALGRPLVGRLGRPPVGSDGRLGALGSDGRPAELVVTQAWIPVVVETVSEPPPRGEENEPPPPPANGKGRAGGVGELKQCVPDGSDGSDGSDGVLAEAGSAPPAASARGGEACSTGGEPETTVEAGHCSPCVLMIIDGRCTKGNGRPAGIMCSGVKKPLTWANAGAGRPAGVRSSPRPAVASAPGRTRSSGLRPLPAVPVTPGGRSHHSAGPGERPARSSRGAALRPSTVRVHALGDPIPTLEAAPPVLRQAVSRHGRARAVGSSERPMPELLIARTPIRSPACPT